MNREGKTRIFWHVLFLLCVGIPAWAQFHFDVWTAENGLPQNIVRGIFQSPDGYLWIATLDGVARFDGVRFTVFNKSNTPGILSNRFSSMAGSLNGDLWLATEGGRITRYHHASFEPCGPAQGIPDNAVRAITGDGTGRLWALLTHTIAEWNEAADRFIDITPKALPIAYKSFRWENAGFWGSDKKVLHCFARGRFTDYQLPAWLSGLSIWEAAIDQGGTVWLETFDGKHVSIAAGETRLQADAMTRYVDHQGHSWNMRIGHQLYRSVQQDPSSGEMFSSPFSELYEDREGSLWLGTEGQGLYRLQRESIHVYSKKQGLVDRSVYPVFQDRLGAVWIGAWGSGLSRFDKGRFINYTVKDGLPNGLTTALYEDHEGVLWIGTHHGLCIFQNGRFRKPAGPSTGDESPVQAIFQDAKGTLWFGTSQGLSSYSKGTTALFTTRDGLATNDVRVIVGSSSGDLWIGGYGGLTKLHQGRFTHSIADGAFSSDNIRSLYEDSDAVLWIGTYDDGLARLRDGQLTRYRERNGLFNNGVFQILEDAHANLWMSCNRGIYRVSKQELNRFAAKQRNTITSVAYGKSDGMLNVECNGGFWPAGAKSSDGKLWFPTQNGVAVVDPKLVPVNLKYPPVVIESSLLDSVPVPVTSTLRIVPGKQNLEIRYTALSFIKSNQIRFKYMMDGLDESWVDAGSRRTAYYSHMPPGKYLFRVIAGNSDGVWNTAGRSLPVIVLAPFYKTGPFVALALFGCVALLWALMNYRVAQAERAQAAQQSFSQQLIASQESERKRIAAELHDSLGQRLVVINNLALFFLRAHRTHPSGEGQLQSIEEISTEAALAIEETRSISYNLRPFQLDRLGLTKSIEALIRTVSKSSGIHFSTDLADVDELFPEELRINLYRIVQEAFSNILKHAHATEIEVHILRGPDQVTLSIRDNGRGLAPLNRTSPSSGGGFGLTGMAERAALLGGVLKMRSEAGKGTVMTVSIPLGRDGTREHVNG